MFIHRLKHPLRTLIVLLCGAPLAEGREYPDPSVCSPPYCPGGVGVPNQQWGYYPTKWRTWPNNPPPNFDPFPKKEPESVPTPPPVNQEAPADTERRPQFEKPLEDIEDLPLGGGMTPRDGAEQPSAPKDDNTLEIPDEATDPFKDEEAPKEKKPADGSSRKQRRPIELEAAGGRAKRTATRPNPHAGARLPSASRDEIAGRILGQESPSPRAPQRGATVQEPSVLKRSRARSTENQQTRSDQGPRFIKTAAVTTRSTKSLQTATLAIEQVPQSSTNPLRAGSVTANEVVQADWLDPEPSEELVLPATAEENPLRRH